MASCVRNIRTTNYRNLIIGYSQVTVENVGDAFLKHSVLQQRVYMTFCRADNRRCRCFLHNFC